MFAFFDLVMAGLGVCQVEDLAASVLTSVIGHQREKGWIITDAGWMAMSRDRGTARQRVDQGYGLACDLDGRPIGTLLRILPNHACATAAQHGQYQVVRGSREIEAVWTRFNGC